MHIVIFGLTVSSSWGNGHATLWRGLIRALSRMGHEVTFFERDVAYYAQARDLDRLPGDSRLLLYPDWAGVAESAAAQVAAADVAMVTSYCPDGAAAADLVLSKARGLTVFYDLDTPATLANLGAGVFPAYLPATGLQDFDLVLSYTGGEALSALCSRLNARRVAPLYGHVDPEFYAPAEACEIFRADLSYLGTFAPNRQAALETLFIEAARQSPHMRFVLAGACYPEEFPWTQNMFFVRHLPPPYHPAFFCSSRLTLNVTREDMAAMGFCPSGRLFEAAACGVPVISDWWVGLDHFFEPGSEILIAEDTAEVVAALELPRGETARTAQAARARVLKEHTSHHRARELIKLLRDPDSASAGRNATARNSAVIAPGG